MSRRLLGATLLACGLCGLLPNLGIAQAPPIQDDPQARDHVLRLPPSYNPATDAASDGNQTPRSDGSQYGGPQYGPYGSQPQPPQISQNSPYQGSPYQGSPYQGGPYQGGPYQGGPYQGSPAPRYGGSLLGAPNVQTPGYGPPPTYGSPQPYGSGQAVNPGYGGSQPPSGGPQAGSGIPPVQSPRYGAAGRCQRLWIRGAAKSIRQTG